VIPKRRMMACGRACVAGALCFAAASLAGGFAAVPASAQQVLLVVNGDVITDYDVDQRSKFIALSTHKPPPRQEVIETLIDERLKVQVGRKYKVEIPDADIDSSYSEMSRRMHLNADLLTKELAKGGVDAATLKARIRADLTWSVIIRGKFQAALQVNEKTVLAEVASTKKDTTEDIGYDYTLRPILFLAPKGNNEIIEARRKDAEGLRTRFAACDTGLTTARLMRDVVVRDAITKNSSELAPALREIIEKTEIGHLTPPETTDAGIEFFALCERKATKAETPEKRAAQEKLVGERFQNQAKRYLQELRRQAMIERK
jgi:peptidyl-prolyl cis-trans isomerase SurA